MIYFATYFTNWLLFHLLHMHPLSTPQLRWIILLLTTLSTLTLTIPIMSTVLVSK